MNAPVQSRLADRIVHERIARWPFRNKLTLLMLTSAGIALFIASMALIATHYRHDRQSADRRYLQIADVIASSITAAVVFRDEATVLESIASVRRIADIDAVAVFDERGRRIAYYAKQAVAADSLPGGAARLPDAQGAGAAAIAGSAVVAPIELHGNRVGSVVMLVSRNSFADNFRASYPSAIAVFLVGLGLAYAVGRMLRTMVFGPIDRLNQAMQAIGDSGDFSTRLADERDPDFNQITQSFNYMLGEIESRKVALSAALEEVREARDAEQISEAKSQFMANMSHELRTPLNAIIGYAEVLMEDLAQTDLDQSYEDVSWIYRSAEQLRALINSVLDFSKISAGKMTIEVREFDPVELLAEVEGMLEPMAQAGGNVLEVRACPSVGLVRNDPTKLKQCLLNLGSNACKFTHGGTVSITAYQNGDTLVVEVIDTGEGIDPDAIAGLFEPFIQGDASTTRKHGGTGLGLPITRELARMMGGDVMASSEPGCGSIFMLEIASDAGVPDSDGSPADAPAVAGPTDAADDAGDADAPAANGGAVVVIDDAPGPQDILRLVRQAGHRVALAISVPDAFQQISARDTDLVLLDIDMVGADGWELLARTQNEPWAQTVPVVAIGLDSDRARPIAMGAADYLTKPVDPVDLGAILDLYTESGAGTVLIVDGDRQAAQRFRKAVEQLGYAARIADDAADALTILDADDIVLVLTDLSEGQPGGHELVDAIAARPDAVRLPVVVVTSGPVSREEIGRLRGKVRELHSRAGMSPRLLAQLVSTHAEPGRAVASQGRE